jgi:hypothetical protein
MDLTVKFREFFVQNVIAATAVVNPTWHQFAADKYLSIFVSLHNFLQNSKTISMQKDVMVITVIAT